MKYKYTIKIHNVIDYAELESILNKYGSDAIRTTASSVEVTCLTI